MRYADDFVVMCRRDVEEPLKVVRQVLERLGLSMNESKTRIVDATRDGFNFLGFSIQMMKRHKVKDRGIGEGRFPSVELYERYGLYKVSTVAGFRSAHALT